MKILFLIESLSAGGAQRQLVNLMNGLTQKGYNVNLITWIDNNHYNATQLPNINWIQLSRNYKFNFLPLFFIRKFIQKNKIKIVQGFLDTGNLYAWFSTILLRNVHVFASDRSSKRPLIGFSKFHKRFVHKYVDKTIVNSLAGKEFIHEISGAEIPVEVIRNGFDVSYFNLVSDVEKIKLRIKYGIDSQALVYINVARITPIKRNLEIVLAFESLFKDTNAVLILIGHPDVEYLTIINEKIDSLGLQGVVKIFSPNHDIRDFYQLSDIFILNSIFEGSPNALVEAMLCGLVILSNSCGDSFFYLEKTIGNELIINGDFEALKKGMFNLFKLKSFERKRIGLFNHFHLHNNLDISISSLVNKYENLYLSYELSSTDKCNF